MNLFFSDETNDGSGRGNRGGGGWLSKGGFGGGNQLAKESPGTCNNNNQEITYVPTAMLKSRAASNASLSGRSVSECADNEFGMR